MSGITTFPHHPRKLHPKWHDKDLGILFVVHSGSVTIELVMQPIARGVLMVQQLVLLSAPHAAPELFMKERQLIRCVHIKAGRMSAHRSRLHRSSDTERVDSRTRARAARGADYLYILGS